MQNATGSRSRQTRALRSAALCLAMALLVCYADAAPATISPIALAFPLPISAANLVYIAGALAVLLLIAGGWCWILALEVRRQAAVLKAQKEAASLMERRNAQMEQRRIRILEDINTASPLPELILQITELVSFTLNDAFCWCEMTDGSRMGKTSPADAKGLRLIHRDIPEGSSGLHGTLFVALETKEDSELEAVALESGIRLAALSMETRKLHRDLAYRSEFDFLTDIYNRSSLERYLEQHIAQARENESLFGLIYIDLDDFKLVNDQYGHRVGDLYLQEISVRMKRQLRSGDMLARLGGDEFAALVPVMRGRASIEEIAQRLERCFDAPFAVEGRILRGAASVGYALYPDDGTNADSLLNAADAAMFVSKDAKRSHSDKPGRLQASLFKPGSR